MSFDKIREMNFDIFALSKKVTDHQDASKSNSKRLIKQYNQKPLNAIKINL